MKKVLALIPALLLVVSISGCTQGGGGLAGINLLQTGGQEKEAPNDVLAKKSSKIVPSPPIPASSQFTLTFYLENQMPSKEKLGQVQEAKDTQITLYDCGRCKFKENNGWKEKCFKEYFGSEQDIFPGATKIIEWEFKAPSNENLGRMTGECPIRYKVEYGYDASTRADAIVASQRKIEQASRAGESIQVSPTESKGRGPIKIDVRFASNQPFRAEKGAPTKIPFSVIVKNKGSGEIAERKVQKNEINIEAPADKVNVTNCKYPQTDTTPYASFIGKETPPIMCELTVEDGAIKDNAAVMKTFTIEADLNYNYTLNYKETVTVEPTYTGMGG